MVARSWPWKCQLHSVCIASRPHFVATVDKWLRVQESFRLKTGMLYFDKFWQLPRINSCNKQSFFNFVQLVDEPNIYYVQASQNGIALSSENTIRRYNEQMRSCDWNSLTEVFRCAFGVWRICFNRDEWRKSTCTCPVYMKQYICKHVIGIAIKFK